MTLRDLREATIRTPQPTRLTIRQLLDFEILASAEPQVVAGDSRLESVVRWVHSSEIYEMASLLSAGDLLLTTGLGLVSRTPAERRQYITDLADRGVAGLVFELGRSFSALPVELAAEATRLGFPLIALHRVVPFIRVTEAANTWIVDRSGQRLRLGDEVTRALNERLISGAGIGALLARAAEITRTPLVLVSATGALVTAHGVDDHRSAWVVVDDGQAESTVTLHGEAWGRLVAGPGTSLDADDLAAVVDRTAVAVALAMLQAGRPPSGQDRQVAGLLADLVGTEVIGEADVALRAASAGFTPAASHRLVGTAALAPELGAAYAVLDRAARAMGTACLRARVLNAVYAVLAVPPAPPDPVGWVRLALTEAQSRVGGGVRIAVGHAVDGRVGLSQVRASLRDARTTLDLAATAMATSLDLALELQLTRHNDRSALAAIAMTALEPVIGWDAERHSALVFTLETYLRNGCSPTKTAAALHLGRQSLYQRLDRMRGLLGHRIDVPERHAGLLVAAVAHRLSAS